MREREKRMDGRIGQKDTIDATGRKGRVHAVFRLFAIWSTIPQTQARSEGVCVGFWAVLGGVWCPSLPSSS